MFQSDGRDNEEILVNKTGNPPPLVAIFLSTFIPVYTVQSAILNLYMPLGANSTN